MIAESSNPLQQNTNKKSYAIWIVSLIVVLLIIAQIWSIIRINKQGKFLQEALSDISILEGRLTIIDSNVSGLQGNISGLQSDMAYVTSIAENANFYAHSHPYSDVRLKTDIAPISGSLESVLAIHGVRFTWSEEAISKLNLSNTTQIGLIAQEVDKFFPEVVTLAPNGYRTVNYDGLIPVLFEAIQEQQAIIDSLQLRISAIEHQR